MFDFSREPGKTILEREFNTNGKPLVSIITPYFNAGKYFEQTFNCVMNQTFPWYEWIIVNDGSTRPEDVELLEKLASSDKRIKLFHKENSGAASARNYAIKMSTTEHIIPLDADDLIDPTYVEVLYWTLYFNPDRSWAYTKSIGFQGQEYLWDKPFDAALEKIENHLTNSAIIRKSDLLEVGCYDEKARYYNEDWYLWLKLLSNSKKPIKIGYYGFWYRRRTDGALSQVNNSSELKEKDNKLIKEIAFHVDTSVTVKEYPYASTPGQYVKPRRSNWERKTFKEHKKIHIMMLIPWMTTGGADLFNLEIVKRIDKDRFEVGILTTVHNENELRQQFEDYVTDIFELPSFLDICNFAEFISYYIISREIDVIFLSNSYYGYYLVPWIRKEFPNVAIVDYVHMEEWYWRNGGHARVSGVMGRILDKTYVCNERTRRVMINSFGREPESVETIYIGVDDEKYNAEHIESGIARKQLGIGADRPVVLFPCRIHPQKRPFLMLKIAKELRKELQDVAFMVVGDGPQLNELMDKTKAEGLEGTIYFAGMQNNMLPFYKDSDVTLICSLKEGLSLTAYESLSMGKPVVSVDAGGQSELIDEKVGAIIPLMQNETSDLDNRNFPSQEIMLYVSALKDILCDKSKYEKLCNECRSRIKISFSCRKMVEKLQYELLAVKSNSEKRNDIAAQLCKFEMLANDYVTLYNEIENYENVYKYAYTHDARSELMRIANSKWGSRLIKIAFKLRLNKLFK
jgi:glycosyltransferase involved in cell wall biosynthesis